MDFSSYSNIGTSTSRHSLVINDGWMRTLVHRPMGRLYDPPLNNMPHVEFNALNDHKQHNLLVPCDNGKVIHLYHWLGLASSCGSPCTGKGPCRPRCHHRRG